MTDIEKKVMSKVTSNEIVMKPRWYFVAGSIISIVGLISLGVIATFLINLSFFLLREHGPMGQWRLQQIISSFPLWVPLLAVFGIYFGIDLLKKYDFSYKKNFGLIVSFFIVSIILTAFILDYSGLDNIWMRRGPMMRFYQQESNTQQNLYKGGTVKGWRYLH